MKPMTQGHKVAPFGVGPDGPGSTLRKGDAQENGGDQQAPFWFRLAQPLVHCILFTVTNGPGSVETPATVAITSRFPSGALGGTFTTIW